MITVNPYVAVLADDTTDPLAKFVGQEYKSWIALPRGSEDNHIFLRVTPRDEVRYDLTIWCGVSQIETDIIQCLPD